MSAILTDQFRILRASDFVAGINSASDSYYAFLSTPYTDEIDLNWSTSIPDPYDSFDQENSYYDSIVALSKINYSDVRQVIKKYVWTSGETYEMYRHDYSRNNLSPQTSSTRLYDARFYVLNKDYRVYICLQNGTDPDNPRGRPSINEPTHTSVAPQAAGDGSDFYLWKYLYTINPVDVIKFDSTDYIPVPQDWSTNTNVSSVRTAAVDGEIEVVIVTNSGIGYGSAQTYNNIPILGDGTGAKASVSVSSEGKVTNVTVTSKGSGYSYGTLDITNYISHTGVGTTTLANFDVIIPPKGGHGSDIYRELGTNKVLLYSRFENLQFQNPDVIASNSFARLGIMKNPKVYGSSSVFMDSTASGLYAIKLTGAGSSTLTFVDDERVTQTIGIGSTAVGRVASYDQTTQVLKIWQDRSLVLSQPKGGPSAPAYGVQPEYGYQLFRFTGSVGPGGSLTIEQPDNLSPNGLGIDTSFNGTTTVINSRTYNLGQNFVNGVANPEIQPRSGEIIYIDNRDSIPRSKNQKEDVKIIIEF
jgi:hypothetical protein